MVFLWQTGGREEEEHDCFSHAHPMRFQAADGQSVPKLTATLSHAQRADHLAVLYCLQVERFPARRRRRLLGDIPKAAECVGVYLSNSPVSAA